MLHTALLTLPNKSEGKTTEVHRHKLAGTVLLFCKL